LLSKAKIAMSTVQRKIVQLLGLTPADYGN
jgi:ribosomal protein L30/L7E